MWYFRVICDILLNCKKQNNFSSVSGYNKTQKSCKQHVVSPVCWRGYITVTAGITEECDTASFTLMPNFARDGRTYVSIKMCRVCSLESIERIIFACFTCFQSGNSRRKTKDYDEKGANFCSSGLV